MKERPILFSGPMVRAILDGREPGTRRVVDGCVESPGAYSEDAWKRGEMPRCPYGAPGDRLWVRETWRTGKSLDALKPTAIAKLCTDAGYSHPWAPLLYMADGRAANEDTLRDFGAEWGRTRPSIHMPRWASRITLDVKSVRVERLHDITDDDALAEWVIEFARIT